MAGEIPVGLAVERVWVVEAAYAPDAAERRLAVRAEHLARIAELRQKGTILEAGAYADMSASLVLIRAPSEEAALEVVRNDAYYLAGIWTGFHVRSLARVVRAEELSSD